MRQSAGFIEAHWDLNLIVGCPLHRSRLLSRCPKCHLGLRWLGQACSSAIAVQCSGELMDHLCLKTKMSSWTSFAARSWGSVSRKRAPLGCPSQLSALSLGGLLSLTRTLAKFHLQLKTLQQLDDPQCVVTAAAHVLRSFPANFHKLLWTIGEQHVPKRCGGSIRSQFSRIYTCIFKYRADDPPEVGISWPAHS